MKGTTNAQRNAIVDSTSAVDSLTLTKADGTTQKHTVSNIIPKDDAPTSGSSKFVTSGAVYTALNGKVSVVSGKGLSTNDYTTAEKSKVSNLPDNANNTFATKTELTNAVSSVYKYKGTKATYSALPTSGNTAGDVWNVTAANGNIPAGTNYAWNGSAWDALGGEIDLSGYVPTSRTVNGKALTGNITLAASDVSAVPTTRKVNNKALSADITLSAADVGALATSGTAAKATADASGNNIVNTYATKTELTNGLAGKQNALTFDSAPTSGSSNPVTSGGVYSAINNVKVSEVSGLINDNNELVITVNGVSGAGIPLPESEKVFEFPALNYNIPITSDYTPSGREYYYKFGDLYTSRNYNTEGFFAKGDYFNDARTDTATKTTTRRIFISDWINILSAFKIVEIAECVGSSRLTIYINIQNGSHMFISISKTVNISNGEISGIEEGNSFYSAFSSSTTSLKIYLDSIRDDTANKMILEAKPAN